MTTVVRGRPGQPTGFDSFANLTEVAVAGISWDGDDLVVEFAGDLTETVAAEVQRRIEARTGQETVRARLEAAAAAFADPNPGLSAEDQLAAQQAVIRDLICVALGTGETS
jgi:hypothetical protein